MLRIIKPRNLSVFRIIPNISRIKNNYKRCYLYLKYDEDERNSKSVSTIIKARIFFDSTINEINNLLKKEDNELIKKDIESNDKEDKIEDYLGRINKKINEDQENTLEALSSDAKERRAYNFISTLDRIINSLIFIPLTKGYSNFIKENPDSFKKLKEYKELESSEIEKLLYKIYLEFKSSLKFLAPKTAQEMSYNTTMQKQQSQYIHKTKPKREIEPEDKPIIEEEAQEITLIESEEELDNVLEEETIED